ncbi:FAD-dependent oxidoreductase [Candidatus Parcubacteria bacterium]|nr:FAD-dependent oxidoreductase [Candidatus Parcubacteria bacterium]
MFELAIIGGGPAGVSAGVYAARKRLKTILITETWGGQSTESAGIENWIGTKKISGNDFGQALENHVKSYEGPDFAVKAGELVEKVSKNGKGFEIKTNMASYQAKAVLVATGSSRRKLEIPGAKEYENKGITYCASCDGPLFAGQDVAVIGGGNAGFETAAQLLAYAKSVTLLHHGAAFKADARTVETVLAHPNMKAILNADTKEIKGEKFVKGLAYRDPEGEHELAVGGIFVEIGLMPRTSFVLGLVEMNQIKQITVDPKTQRTSQTGVWAAGDSTDALFHQNNIAAGDAVKALEDIYLSLRT